jgi:hypothetical protein
MLHLIGALSQAGQYGDVINYFRLDFEIHNFYTKFSRFYLGTKSKI